MEILTRKEKITLIATLGALAAILIAFTFCTPSQAAEPDAAYYQRTGTKPPMQVDGVIGPGIFVAGNLGFGLSGGPLFHTKKSGDILLLFTAAAVELDGISGVATLPANIPLGCPPIASIPYETGPRTVGVFGASILFVIGKRK